LTKHTGDEEWKNNRKEQLKDKSLSLFIFCMIIGMNANLSKE